MNSHLNSGAGFPAGTRINTDKGLISIQNIKVADLVLCRPQNGQGELCYKPIVRTVFHENKEPFSVDAPSCKHTKSSTLSKIGWEKA